jgi:hypothetical protein
VPVSNKRREKKRKRKKKRRLQMKVAVGPPKLTGGFTVEPAPFDPDDPTKVVMNIGLELQQDYLCADIELEE